MCVVVCLMCVCLSVVYSVEFCGVCLFVFMCTWFRCLTRLCVFFVFDVLCDVVWCVPCIARVCVCVWLKCVCVF